MTDFISLKDDLSGLEVTINQGLISSISKDPVSGGALFVMSNGKTIVTSIDYGFVIANLYAENFYPTKKTVKK